MFAAMAAPLDRHAVDAIARAVVSGRRGLGSRADALADRVAGMMRNRLAAMGAPGSARAATLAERRGPLAAEPPLVRRVLDRVAKHLSAVRGAGARSR
jgi:hypothetical protein